MKLQLSISLLISNRRDTYERCLDSLLPLLREVSSELIIVYTGDQPDILERVRDYTDHIIPFSWCNDFSAARNTGLKEASGEWFLFIDDDEWFEDCSEIVTFFKSGEYRNYGMACYQQRNYTDWEGRGYVDASVSRLIRLDSEVRFVSSIHEFFHPPLAPMKYFKAFVHHFGYMVNDPQNVKSKFKRNIPLLLEELKKDPNYIRIPMQLVQEYVASGDYKNAEKYCRMALKAKPEHWIPLYGDWLLCMLPQVICLQGNMEQALEEGRKILKFRNPAELASLGIYINLSQYARSLKKYQEGLDYVKDFHKTILILDETPKMWAEQAIMTLGESSIRQQSDRFYINGMYCAAEIKDYDSLAELLSWLPWNSGRIQEDHYVHLENWKQSYKSEQEHILGCFKQLETNNFYVVFQKSLLAELQNEKEKLYELWQQCMISLPQNLSLLCQLLKLGLRNEFNLDEIANSLELESFKMIASTWVGETEATGFDALELKLNVLMPGYPLYLAIVKQKIQERNLTEGYRIGAEFYEEMQCYCETIQYICSSIYNEKLMAEHAGSYLPKEYEFSQLIQIAMQQAKEKKYSESIGNIKKTLRIYPRMIQAVKKLLMEISRQMKDSDIVMDPEFLALSNQIKATVKNLIDIGDYEQAYPIIIQLSQLIPKDMEVIRWKQKILRES